VLPPIKTQPGEPAHVPPTRASAESAPVPRASATPAPVVADSPPNPNPPAPVALAVQPEPGFSRLGLVRLGVAITILAGGLFFALQRRARQAAHASLITRSFDRDRK
jgi:hypothetical protein